LKNRQIPQATGLLTRDASQSHISQVEIGDR
jgi:hypothetical protein